MSIYKFIFLDKFMNFSKDFFFVILFFFLGVNTLFPFPLDKLVMTIVVIFLIIYQKKFNLFHFTLLLGILLFLIVSFISNFPNSSFIIFFPIIGLLFSIFIVKIPNFLNLLFFGSVLHILCGIVLLISSYLFKINKYVHPLYDKGLPFLHAPQGFTSTVQTFATLCILCIFIFFVKRQININKKIDIFIYIIILITLLLTYNRNYLIVLFISFLFMEKKFFYLLVIGFLVMYFSFFDYFNNLILNTATISSRGRLLEAFQIAFFEKASIIQYLLGHGNNTVNENISLLTYYKVGYIENGLSVLIFTYGAIGFILYVICISFLIVMVFKNSGFFYAFICGYIFFIAQQFTHEFFSTTFYLLLSFFIYLSQGPIIDRKVNNSLLFK
jgi:hypothetical protein